MDHIDSTDTDALLEQLRNHIMEARKTASMAQLSSQLSPVEEVGQRIRAERKRQELTLNDLCDLSGVAYATLNKIEKGHPSVQLDSLRNVLHSLGMKLWVG